MSMRNVRWVEDVLSRNGGDREMNELIKVLAMCGYEKPQLPMKTASPQAFADRVDTALSDPLSIFHDKVKAVVLNRGYYQPQPANPNVFEIDLTGIPKHLQEVFKVHVDLMFGGLVAGEKKQSGTEFLQWDDESFNAGDALDMVFKNILKGHMADASNFLMFINARGWDISPTLFKRHLPQLPWGEETITVNAAYLPPIPAALHKTKKPNTGFYTMTHGREVPDGYVSQMKDELYEGKLNWIRTVPGYDDLFHVLALAYDQAARGKGKERHANNKPFAQQPLFELADKFSTGFLLGQASKKLEESVGLTYGSDVKELLGAIVYTAAAIMHLEMEAERNAAEDPDELDGRF
ncbi:hypothetical protein SOP91_00090 (plasmid) [Enterobacter hormaechei]|uniref:hypothetical protein n=1 Tax=Enterobacter hormaechei TaxID=158836 RepID=UPI002B4BB88C|nr:hypothetical protein [Enterobacter hormaechei]WRM07109.1 hypothetical protein SOP91_00090 [Enterobacter hormaechei]